VNLGRGETGSRVLSLDLNAASEGLPSNSSGSKFQTAGVETNTGKMVLLESYASRRMVVLDYFYYYKICIAYKFKQAQVRGADVARWGT